jgi:methionine-S-sulfoxide reductase
MSHSKTKKAVLAGGCFWGVEELFRNLTGVSNTEVGYCGGSSENPVYEEVKTGKTGHAEALLIEFNPELVTFEDLLRFFFKMHDPTTKNRQGGDIGSQYRSAIFYESEEQRVSAEKIIDEVTKSGFWKSPLTTEVVPASKFYPAEGYHQDYLRKNPGGYTCHWVRS